MMEKLTLATITAALFAASSTAGPEAKVPNWTAAEIAKIQEYWSDKNRYSSSPGPAFVVRLSVEGSQWLWDYNKKRGRGKTPPGQVPAPIGEDEREWEAWIDLRVAADRGTAQNLAGIENARLLNPSNVPAAMIVQPQAPPPSALVDLAGFPPAFAEAVRPTVHKVNIDGTLFDFEDNVDMRQRYAYYRFRDGVRAFGTKLKTLPDAEVSSLLSSAGITQSEARVFKTVSLLEGGFDSINTYDTGFVSVGFIQFASLAAGGHSLGQTLLRFKLDSVNAYNDDFRRLGIEVTTDGQLVALDLQTGAEVVGPAANAAIIKDKRLIAIFARAGARRPYQIAQLKTARAMYWPMETEIVLPELRSSTPEQLKGKLSEIIRSEAGQAVFMDRKVNTGNIGPIIEVLTIIAAEKPIQKFADFAKYEALIVECLVYRVNPLKDSSLTQPKACEMIPAALKKFGRPAGERR